MTPIKRYKHLTRYAQLLKGTFKKILTFHKNWIIIHHIA